MFVPDFKTTEGKLALIIYDLASFEGEVRERLWKVFEERGNIMTEDIPTELQDDWNYIYHFMTSAKGKFSFESAFRSSVRNKKNKTCSDIVNRIIVLYENIKRNNKDTGI